jgi:multidrug resistance efflux pump
MRDFYLDKRQFLRQKLASPRTLAFGAVILLALFAPVWRETVTARFVLEPQQRAVIRAVVPGEITAVMAAEGMRVAAGAPLLMLRNVGLESQADNVEAGMRSAEAGTRQAQLSYKDIGRARGERTYQFERYNSVSEQKAALQVRSPISGLVVTPAMEDLVGSIADSGGELAEVDDVSTLKARLFIPEFQVPKVSAGAEVSLKLESQFQPIRGQVSSMAPAPSPINPGLAKEEQYKGIAPPSYYVATILLSNPERRILPGMSGDAKIYFRRRSLAGFIFEGMREFASRKIW